MNIISYETRKHIAFVYQRFSLSLHWEAKTLKRIAPAEGHLLFFIYFIPQKQHFRPLGYCFSPFPGAKTLSNFKPELRSWTLRGLLWWSEFIINFPKAASFHLSDVCLPPPRWTRRTRSWKLWNRGSSVENQFVGNFNFSVMETESLLRRSHGFVNLTTNLPTEKFRLKSYTRKS